MSVPWQHLNKVLHFVCEFRESSVVIFTDEAKNKDTGFSITNVENDRKKGTKSANG